MNVFDNRSAFGDEAASLDVQILDDLIGIVVLRVLQCLSLAMINPSLLAVRFGVLDIEQEVTNVAVLHFVVFAFDSQLAIFL